MADLEIFGFPQSTYVRVVRMVCAEKNVPYKFVASARPHGPEVSAIHPFGKIPVMRHGDFVLFESKAIATYIDSVFDGPRVIPEEARAKAQVEQWVSITNTLFDNSMIREYVLGYVFADNGKPDRARIDAAAEKMTTQARVLDAAVAGGHLVGDRFTLADINLMPILFYVRQFPEGRKLMEENRNLGAYYARHAERPSFAETSPPKPA